MKKRTMSIFIFLALLLLILSGCIKIGYTVSGCVEDANGNKLSEVIVTFEGDSKFSAVITDLNGYWSKSNLHGNVKVRVSKDSYSFTPDSTLISKSTDKVNFTAIKLYTVSGHILDSKGKGIRGVNVNFTDNDGNSYDSVITDTFGYWKKTNLHGEVKITVFKSSYVFGPLYKIVSSEKDNVNFVGTYIYGLSGNVKDSNGNPVKDVEINFYNSDGREFDYAKTDSNGNWTKTGLYGTVSVSARKIGYDFGPDSITVKGSSENINFGEKYTISGYVKDVDGNGIEVATINFYSNDDSKVSFDSVTTDLFGHWSKSGLYGSVSVSAKKEGCDFGPNSIIINKSIDRVSFGERYTVSGYVKDAMGNAISGVTVSFEDSSGNKIVGDTITDSNGHWSKYGVYENCYVSASKEGYNMSPGYLTVEKPNSNVNFIDKKSSLYWKYSSVEDIESSPIIDNNGNVYFVSKNNYMYAITPEGDLYWRISRPEAFMTDPVIDENGTIYVGTDNDKLYAINSSDGSTKWVRSLTQEYNNSVRTPAISSDGTVYFATSERLYSINGNDGTLNWKHDTPPNKLINSNPVIGPDGTVYIGVDYSLYAIDSDGNKIWEYPTNHWFEISPSIDSDGTVYIVDGSNLYSINPGGTLKWKKEIKTYTGVVIGSDGTLYVGSDDLCALNPNTGDIIWKYGAISINYDSGPVVGADNTIYVAGYEGLYTINSDGSLKWIYDGCEISKSNPAIIENGTIYFGSSNFLYAIHSQSYGLENSPWPKTHHDNRNSNCSDEAPQ
jgi:outer membrane protein assembly factor BamB/protocatechuate 3,4-dioxygenase beta subunit